MGNYEQLKQAVADVIKTNGNQEITGEILQNTLLSIISTVGGNATFAGIATPETNPGTPDQNVFYIASENGTYSNFGSIILSEEVAILSNKGSRWVKSSTGIATSAKVTELGYKTQSINYVYGSFCIADKNGYILIVIDENSPLSSNDIEKSVKYIQSVMPLMSIVSIKDNGLFVSDPNDYIALYVDDKGKSDVSLKDRMFITVPGEYYCDSNGYIAVGLTKNGEILTPKDVGQDYNYKSISASQAILESPVVSNLDYEHAFNATVEIGLGGNAIVLYGSSYQKEGEGARTTDYRFAMSQFNISSKNDITHNVALERTALYQGSPMYEIYNNSGIKLNNKIHNIFSCNLNVSQYDAKNPQQGYYSVDLANGNVSEIQMCKLLYDGNILDFTINNYYRMLYDKGFTPVQYESVYDTISNEGMFEYNNKIYKICVRGDDEHGGSSMPYILLSTTDFVNWSFEKKLNVAGSNASEIDAVVVNNYLYCLSRTSSMNPSYFKYDLINDVVVSSGVLDDGLPSLPCVFEYRGKPYYAYSIMPEKISDKYPDNYLAWRIATKIVDADTYENKLQLINSFGINYTNFCKFGEEKNYEKLFMVASEDKRDIFPVRKFSDIYFVELTNYLN